ncbi:hypothetical protein GE09DRAFT_167383 [Coniochaeta sp. 2T2.1]|nr:hypothetical protein GE09DRAFT_167383 [Coniochaeta sp. 2T2.1]
MLVIPPSSTAMVHLRPTCCRTLHNFRLRGLEQDASSWPDSHLKTFHNSVLSCYPSPLFSDLCTMSEVAGGWLFNHTALSRDHLSVSWRVPQLGCQLQPSLMSSPSQTHQPLGYSSRHPGRFFRRAPSWTSDTEPQTKPILTKDGVQYYRSMLVESLVRHWLSASKTCQVDQQSFLPHAPSQIPFLFPATNHSRTFCDNQTVTHWMTPASLGLLSLGRVVPGRTQTGAIRRSIVDVGPLSLGDGGCEGLLSLGSSLTCSTSLTEPVMAFLCVLTPSGRFRKVRNGVEDLASGPAGCSL